MFAEHKFSSACKAAVFFKTKKKTTKAPWYPFPGGGTPYGVDGDARQKFWI